MPPQVTILRRRKHFIGHIGKAASLPRTDHHFVGKCPGGILIRVHRLHRQQDGTVFPLRIVHHFRVRDFRVLRLLKPSGPVSVAVLLREIHRSCPQCLCPHRNKAHDYFLELLLRNTPGCLPVRAARSAVGTALP